MAEEDKNEYGGDEYQLSDFDTLSPAETKEKAEKPIVINQSLGSNVRRNALIALIVIAILILGYKIITPLFTKKPQSEVPPLTTAATSTPVVQTEPTAPPAPPPQPVTEAPIQQPLPSGQVTSADLSQITQRLSDLESKQQTLRSEMDSLNSQLATINSNMNQWSTKLSEFNQTFTNLLAKVEQQSKTLASCTIKMKPIPTRRIVIKAPPMPNYFIQAVIPGRAWLIAQNGSTITVREGTQVAGYGVVKLIDSKQGKILTSSGRVIRFSQQDS